MQLATSQRPHPPPVPPRPSRQVVAEALKRSPRPPCPTRQAPPPPNTKPWRSDQQRQQVVGPAAGRTIIYESIKECVKDIKDESVSDRNAEENRLENGGKIAIPRDHQETSERLHPTGNVPVNIVRKRNSLTEDQRPQRRPEIRRDSRGKDLAGNRRGRCRDSPGKDEESNSATERKNEATTVKPPVAARTVGVSTLGDEVRRASSASPDSGRVAVSHAEKCNGSPEREANGPTPTCRMSPGEQRQDASPTSEKCGVVETAISVEKSTSVASVDRAAATVLVVDDEAERKIAPGDREDGNDSDNNIHRQDWLEAGIRYSSTQITLYGDDGDSDVVDGDRLNGYDHREEERITDLDYISIQERIAMSSLQGLPPLPRSLSGFNLSSGRGESGEPPPPPTRSSSKSQRSGKTSSSRPLPPARQLTTLDTQLAVLRREMFGLRQLDLSLLSQLWSLNESIQEFRQLLQEQEDRAPSPSPSSEEGDDVSYGTHPPPPPRRPAPTLHHHRPPRPPRPPRPSASDESPSSEEYGAV